MWGQGPEERACEDTAGDDHPRARERSLGGNQSCRQPDLEVLASGTVQNTLLQFQLPNLCCVAMKALTNHIVTESQ